MDAFRTFREAVSWQTITVALGVYLVTLVFYRLTLHPLARFPGPKLAAVTRWYEAYYDIIRNGQYTFKIVELHKKYGPIIRISPYELHVIDPAFFEKLYCQDGRWDKYAWTYDAFNGTGAIICTPPHDTHKARRQPLNHFFSKAKVATRQDIIHSNVEKLCVRISQFSGNTIDLGAALSAMARDIACDFVLNKTYDSLGKEDFNVGMTNMLQKAGFIWRVTKHVPWFGPIVKSFPPNLMKIVADEGTKSFLEYLQESEQDTKNLLQDAAASSVDDEKPRTIVHEIVNSRLDPAEKKFHRVFDDVATITGAGFETTASVMRLIVFHIFSDAKILERLRAELTAMSRQHPLSADAKTDIKTLEKCSYLTSVLMEGMRLSPAIGSRMARIAPDRDLSYGDWRIPAGTPVGMTTILMHTDKTLYPEPLKFNPDRWMNPEARKKLDRVYAPFSRGTRICLGMHLAWAEMYLTIATIAQRFDFKIQDVEAADFEMESDQFIIGTRGECRMKASVVPRQN